MNQSDALRLLGVAGVYDKRTTGETEAGFWARSLDDLDPKTCAEAIVDHFGRCNNSAYLIPAHIRWHVENPRPTGAGEVRNNCKRCFGDVWLNDELGNVSHKCDHSPLTTEELMDLDREKHRPPSIVGPAASVARERIDAALNARKDAQERAS